MAPEGLEAIRSGIVASVGFERNRSVTLKLASLRLVLTDTAALRRTPSGFRKKCSALSSRLRIVSMKATAKYASRATPARSVAPGVLPRLVRGALCGAVATAPMTMLMGVLHRCLPAGERYPLPPRLITMNVARRAGVASEMNEEERSAATLVAHFGYGAGVGALFAAIPQRTELDVISRGLLFGAVVWGVSYLGVLPGMSLLPSATRQPIRRSGLMIAAHLVWGIALSVLEELARKNEKTSSSGL